MKYEYLCGHESDFFTMPANVIAVVRLDYCVQGLTELSQIVECGKPVLAMRRIIKEPVAPVWTKKDRESETLPELGSLIVGESSGVVYEVIKVTKAGVVIFADTPDDVVGYYDKRDILLFFKPIETPAEKSQREEDEFVDVIVSEYNNMPSSISFKAGIRAAYRKLKGGE